MKIEEIINEKYIYLDEDLNDKGEVFDFLINKLYILEAITDKEKFMDAVLYRETLSATGLLDGVAIPHGVSDVVKMPSVIYVRTKQTVKWETIDDNYVKHIFLLAIPENSEDNLHIKMISELARSLIKHETILLLSQAKDSKQIMHILQEGGRNI